MKPLYEYDSIPETDATPEVLAERAAAGWEDMGRVKSRSDDRSWRRFQRAKAWRGRAVHTLRLEDVPPIDKERFDVVCIDESHFIRDLPPAHRTEAVIRSVKRAK